MSNAPAAPAFRLFIALVVPDSVKNSIQMAQAELRRVMPENAARWTKPEQFHLTVKFLGNVATAKVDELVVACSQVCRPHKPLSLSAGKIGFFPDARAARVIWVGINDSEDRLARIWCAVQSAVQPFTCESEETKFTGHVTLARLKRLRRDQVEALVRTANKFEKTVFGQWTATQLELMRSELLPQGARHSMLAALPLLGVENAL